MARAWLIGVAVLVVAVGWSTPASSHTVREGSALRKIGPAAEFALTAQDGSRVTLSDLRGKVVLVTFIFASCTDTCPLLTAKLVGLGRRLGSDLGSKVAFVAITVDPEQDTPEVLRRHAEGYGANVPGWAFVTGTPAEIQEVARRYGIYRARTARGDVEHTFLTSLVDRQGVLRVQYLGVRFDPDEMLDDLRTLLREGRSP